MSNEPRFINREVSWLHFNRRVLAEAENPDVPLLERLRFCAIVSSNLDEFFMVRMAMVARAVEAGAGPIGPDRTRPRALLRQLSEAAHTMVADQERLLNETLMPALAEQDIHWVEEADLTASDREELLRWFTEEVYPVLTPMAVDQAHPFPLLTSCVNHVLFRVRAEGDGPTPFTSRTDTVLVQVPPGLPQLVTLSAPEDAVRVVPLDTVIILFAEQFLPGFTVEGAWPFRVTRDADIEVDDEEEEDLLQAMEQMLHSRRRGNPVRLEILAGVPAAVVKQLTESLGLKPAGVYRARSDTRVNREEAHVPVGRLYRQADLS